jgi:hypothetical protein
VPWFLVDDHFHSHPKVLATEPAALGLWAVAGSWSSEHLTNGVVRDDVLPRLFPDAVKLAEALVAAGLWKRVKGGYKFVQGVTCKIPEKEAVENERRAAAERQRRSREGRRSRRDSPVTHAGSHRASDPYTDTYKADVVNHPADRTARADPVIDEIIKAIYAATSRVIDQAWAARIRDHILNGHQAGNPVAYVRAVIENDPDPATRFLEH